MNARWWIASQLNRLRGQCWAGLATWALKSGPHRRSPWSPIGSMCRSDYARNGSCYCGKLRQP